MMTMIYKALRILLFGFVDMTKHSIACVPVITGWKSNETFGE